MTARSFDRTVRAAARIRAPIDDVWTEIVPLHRHLTHSREVVLVSAGELTKARLTLSLGPFRWHPETELRVVESERPVRLAWIATLTNADGGASGVLDLADRGGGETTLDYEVQAWLGRMAGISGWFARASTTIVSDHAEQLVQRVQTQAEKHTQARARLLHRTRRPDP